MANWTTASDLLEATDTVTKWSEFSWEWKLRLHEAKGRTEQSRDPPPASSEGTDLALSLMTSGHSLLVLAELRPAVVSVGQH